MVVLAYELWELAYIWDRPIVIALNTGRRKLNDINAIQ